MALPQSDIILTCHCQGFGIQPSEIVQNFTSHDRFNFLNDQELNSLKYAEQFINPDCTVPQTPDMLLRRTQMILTTELGRDPSQRQAMRDLFKAEAQILSTQLNMALIKSTNTIHPLTSSILHHKPISQMLGSTQFLHILAAESGLLVNVSIYLTNEANGRFKRQLNDAFASNSYSDIVSRP